MKPRVAAKKNGELAIIGLAWLCFAYALYIAVKYSNQALLDQYSFRQTQTALTAYWFAKDGFQLAYETPVAGPPWSIPFEFPLYQYLVSIISKSFGFPLDAVGRITSFIFLALCIIPVRSITNNLKIKELSFYIFVALLFSSPVYIYWGRTFMIETAALFFSIAAIKYFIDIIQEKNSLKSGSLFLLFMTIGILQKATTGLPILALLCLIYIYVWIEEAFTSNKPFSNKKIMLLIIYFGIPLLIGVLWTIYTDQIKLLNGLGINLTSKSLSAWNWGTLSQKLSFDLYREVIWKRIIEQNLSGILGVAILLIALLSNTNKTVKSIIVISLLMGLLPIFLFTNLHIVHTYYQSANMIFFIYSVAISLGVVLNNYFKKNIIIFTITVLMIMSNYFWLNKEYFGFIKAKYNKENSRDFSVSEIIKKEIPEGKYFVAFGNDWNSSFAYLSERKSFTVPGFFKQYNEISIHPEDFIDESHLGAVVLCPPLESPTINSLTHWSSNNRNWKVGEVHGCYIAVPETTPLNGVQKISPTICQGNFDFVGEKLVGKENIYIVNGWSTISGDKEIVPEKTYVTITKKNSEPVYLEALQVNRADVNAFFGKANNVDSGFSRIIDTNLLAGEYVIGVSRLNQGQLEACQFEKVVSINDRGNNE